MGRLARTTVVLAASATLTVACGSERTAGPEPPPPTVRATKGPRDHPRRLPPRRPERPAKYVPSAHHAHRVPHSIYNDEIGENVLQASRARILHLFGTPFTQHRGCFYYLVVNQNEAWEFCFNRKGRMTSAGELLRSEIP
jgi:hypothetical protein